MAKHIDTDGSFFRALK